MGERGRSVGHVSAVSSTSGSVKAHAPGTDLEPDAQLEQGQFSVTAKRAISESLTSHQRRVLVAHAWNGVPIDVLAERLDTTRGALYKTRHDARRKLRLRSAVTPPTRRATT
jgi:DNA-directed RNA polymerase specialized sigma24 family protein